MTLLRYGRCLATLVTAGALLGAGQSDPGGSLGLLSFVSDLPASVHPSAAAPTDDVRSYRVKITTARKESFTVIFDDARHAFKFTNADDVRTSTYIVGPMMYLRAHDGTWSKLKLDGSHVHGAPSKQHPPRTAASLKAREKDDQVHVLPDRRIGGVLMTVVTETVPAREFDHHTRSSKPLTITCAFEKETERMRMCDVPALFTATFDRYNDPANQVVVPPEALNAPELSIPSQ